MRSRALRLIRNDFVRDGALLFAATMVVNVFNYGIHFILSRHVGVAEYGSFAALLAAQAIFSVPSAVLAAVIVKYVAEFTAVDDRSRTRLLSERALLIAGSIGALILVGALIFGREIAAYLQIGSVPAVEISALTVAIGLVGTTARAVLQGAQDFRRYSISAVAEGAGKAFLAIGLVYAGFGIAGAFAGYTIAISVVALFTILSLRVHWSRERSNLHLDFRRIAQTMGAAIVTTAAITVIGFIDLPLVKHYFDPSQAGVYGAVTICGRMLFFLVSFVPMIVLPKASARATQGQNAKPVLLQALVLTGALAAGVLALFFLAPGIVVKLTYGTSFAGAAGYIFAYGVAMTLLAGTNVVTTYKIGLHKFDFVGVLIAVVVGEVAGIVLFHRTLMDVILVLMVGNGIGLAGSAIGFELPRRAAQLPAELPDVA